jgi:hypothetical protein
MTQYVIESDEPLLNKSLLWAGTVLLGAAALLGAAGSGLFGAAAVIGLRRHVRGSGLPPSELAVHHWRRAKSAARAGAESWRAQPPGPTAAVPVPRQRQRAPERVG